MHTNHRFSSCALPSPGFNYHFAVRQPLPKLLGAGTTLSGGQRQRIALARAVYSDSDVYLFDDPLSGLDAQVASRVFRQVMGAQGLLRRKTRILVCSQGNLLKHVERILLVHDRRVFSFSNLSALLLDPNAPRTLRSSQLQQAPPTQTTKSTR
ncbi:hypothetical protein HPB50_013314 [Hyalomma asiaticum]|uniref:Uncharacterized protein n=1 Tax=Hyalomma asiaticum TaxID=266040 RepID=A0ACB7RKG7_HYAAI|nr:hypothetical protein HPB50_013314 [Hyalomma asiaticum]